MKRAPSYSDSFLVLNSGSSIDLQPLVIPDIPDTPAELQEDKNSQRRPWKVLCFLLTFKGSFHLLLISGFETLFYFLYVNKSENDGILNTINTYYQPLIVNCQQTWGNGTKWFIRQLLTYEINQTMVDQSGIAAALARNSYNHTLLIWSSMYSVLCLALCGVATGWVWWKRWPVPWGRMLAENMLFVLILGFYEFFFFRTIIYNYETLSTAELNMYIVNGLAQCAAQPTIQNGR
jgi:hypothetical protein